MVYVYLFSLVLGGILLGASVLLGAHGEGEMDVHTELGHPTFDHDAAGAESVLTRFLSARFWTFFLAFFGLTGLSFHALGLLPWWWLTFTLAVGVGLAAGGGASLVVRELARRESNSAARVADLVGKTARVTVGFGPGGTGKVRLEAKGTTQELLAQPIDDATFQPKDEALIVAIEGTTARVARVEDR